MIGRTLLAALLILLPAAATPGPFVSRNLVFRSDAGGNVGVCDLGATLLAPPSPKALVLLVHGSGTSNRDERTPMGHVPFKEIAEHLSSFGFATLRFDKRGFQPECRRPLVDNPRLSPWHFVRDVTNILAQVDRDPSLNRLPVLLLGHSEGVNFVAEAALKGVPRLRGLILLAGLGRDPIDVTLLRQFDQVLKDPSVPAAEKDAVARLLAEGREFFRKLRSGKTAPADRFWRHSSVYWKDWIGITERAAASASRVKAPSFVVRGTADTNVTAADFDALREATRGIPGSAAYAPEGLDHFFAKPGDTRVDPRVLTAVSVWADSIIAPAR